MVTVGVVGAVTLGGVAVPAQAATPGTGPAASSVPVLALAAPAKTNSTLSANKVMRTNDMLVSNNGKYRMIVQSDGNVVVYLGKKPVYSTGTFGHGKTHLLLGPKGNLVIRNAKGKDIWASKTKGKGVSKLVLSDKGTLILYTPKNRVIWTSKAGLTTPPVDKNAFYLPFPKGKSYRINQSPGGSASHSSGNSRFAIDFGMPTGTVVVATKAGTVRDAKWTSGGGGYGVLVDHGGNLCSFYAHLSSFAVTPGQKVVAGQKIALSGATGNATGPHLHFSLVYCSNYGAAKIVKTVEMGTSYPQGAMATSKNG